jgi:hypothetical protein
MVVVNQTVVSSNSSGEPDIFDFELSLRFWFYKKGCQEKKLSRELKAAKSFGVQPPCRCAVPRGVVAGACLACEVAEMFRSQGHRFPKPPFPLIQVRFLQNGPELSRARRFGAAQRTLDSEDRSETIRKEGKEELQLDSISEAQQAKRLHLHVATIVLSETRGL